MSKIESPLSVDEICIAIRGALKKINGVYYSKHRSWLYFVDGAKTTKDPIDYRDIEAEFTKYKSNLELIDGATEEVKDENLRDLALSGLPLCAAHDSEKQFKDVYEFYQLLSKNGTTHGDNGKMALRRLAELYLDLARNNWATSNVLIKSLEQLFSYSYEPEFGSLLCCALMSGWYEEVISIIIPRIQLLGEAETGDVNIENKGGTADNNANYVKKGSRRFRIIEFVAKWFDESAVNMLKGVSDRDPFNYNVFECAKKQRLFFTTEVDNVNRQGGNNEHIGRRYAFLAALLYQLDYSLNSSKLNMGDKDLFGYYWRTANCYANAAHMNEAVYFADKAEGIFNSLNLKDERPLSEDNLTFCGDMMNIYFLNERYDKLTETWKIIMPSENIDECDMSVPKNPSGDTKLLNSVKRRIIIFSASRYRFTSDIKMFKQSIRPATPRKAEFEDICERTWEQFNNAVKTRNERQIIASLFARTVFFNDSEKYHFDLEKPDTNIEQTAKHVISEADKIDSKFTSAKMKKEKDVWFFFKAMVLLKYAVSMSIRNGKQKMVTEDDANEQQKYLGAAWVALKKISSNEKFLMRSKFAIENLRELDNENHIYDSLLFMYLSFRIQDILSISINEIKKMDKLCLYTTTTNLNKWLESSTYKGCPLLMMNVNYFNDPLEGRMIFNYINGVNGINEDYVPQKVFVKSFTQNKDNLPMWDRYADYGTGVCVRLDPSSFGRSAETLETSNESEIIAARVDDSNSIYRVVYCTQKEESLSVDTITMLDEEETGQCSSYRRICAEVEALVEEMKVVRYRIFKNTDEGCDKRWKVIEKVLNYYAGRVSYLFKEKGHKSEQEFRVISYDYDIAKELPAEPFPRIAVAWSNTVTFEEIMFGPRVTDAVLDSCTPYIHRKIEYINRWKPQQDDFTFSHSDIKAR